MTTTEPDSYKNYKYTDPKYYRLYNKQLWDEKLGVSSPCERCGRCVRLGHMRRHHGTVMQEANRRKRHQDTSAPRRED